MSFVRAMVAAAMGLGLAATSPATAKTSAGAEVTEESVRLRLYPDQVYFTTANAKERILATILILIVEEAPGQASTPELLELTFKSKGSEIGTDRWLSPALQAVDIPNFPPSRLHPPELARQVRWPHAYRLMLSVPARASVDSITARLTLRQNGRQRSVTTVLPVRTYEQKTSLIFPFRGEGIISQGGALSSGHRNRSGLYAIDALGLNPTYGPMRVAERDDDPKNYAGWGREIVAPAAGKVVVARTDRPDQPVAGNSDPAYFLPEFSDGGDPGNHVVIDHGEGEFSMIAHMQQGSVRVKVGDRVMQGQLLGLLGNSGDSTGPHVHYQLQNGPDWERSDALPAKFANAGSTDRGAYFRAK